MKPVTTVTIAANRLRPTPAPTAELEVEEPPDAPVAWAEPGAPEENAMTALEPAHTGTCQAPYMGHV
jgi:hypothetical protein